MLIRVIISLFAEIVVIVSLPSERVEIRPELRRWWVTGQHIEASRLVA
jgi:hypothetical protein